jgi:hypothetical protein
MSKAGLLTFGSPYLPLLPDVLNTLVVFTAFVPDNSGGTVPDFHGIPY